MRFLVPILLWVSCVYAVKPPHNVSTVEVPRVLYFPAYIALSLGTVQERTVSVLPQTYRLFLPTAYDANSLLYIPGYVQVSDLSLKDIPSINRVTVYSYATGLGYRFLFDSEKVPLYSGGYYLSNRQMLGIYVLYSVHILQIQSSQSTDSKQYDYFSSSLGGEYWWHTLGVAVHMVNFLFGPNVQEASYDKLTIVRKKGNKYEGILKWSLLGNFYLYALFGGYFSSSLRFERSLGMRGCSLLSKTFFGGGCLDATVGWVGGDDYVLRLSVSVQFNMNYRKNGTSYLPMEQRLLDFPYISNSLTQWEVR